MFNDPVTDVFSLIILGYIVYLVVTGIRNYRLW